MIARPSTLILLRLKQSVEWARQKDENWVNKDITSLEFVENIFRLMNWNRECRYKVLGRVANSDQGLCMLFDLEEANDWWQGKMPI